MARKPERIAWLVIYSSFGLLCLSVAAVVFGFLWYREVAVDSQEAQLTIITGTVLIRSKNVPTWVSATPNMTLGEGDSIKTDQSSQALITLFDKSTVLVYSATELQMVKMSSSRFEPWRDDISLLQARGKAHIGRAMDLGHEKRFEVVTPRGNGLLSEGSYTVSVADDGSQFRVQERGQALVANGGEEVLLKPNERVETSESSVGEPHAAKEELIFNGDFSEGLSGWTVGNDLGFPEGQDVQGKAIPVLDEESPAIRFVRQGSKGTHCETYIYQDINRDVSDFSSLKLTIKLKLINQSLSGGGSMGSEYPLMVRVNYRTDSGDMFSVYGFYYQNDGLNRTDNGVLLRQNVYHQYDVADLKTLSPQPRYVTGIQLSGSGWDYDSLVSNVSLMAE